MELALEADQQHHFHVLAVDDSLIDRKLLEKLLKISSYKVTCVESGSKALEYLGLPDNIENPPSSPPPSPCSSSAAQQKRRRDHLTQSEKSGRFIFSHQKVCYDMAGNLSSTELVLSQHHYINLSPTLEEQKKEVNVNLIITDYCMPGMSGYDLLRRVKKSSWKDVPVVVMSSENVPSRISRCLEGGAEEFLLKPVQLSDMKKLHPHLLKSLNNRISNASSSGSITANNSSNNSSRNNQEDNNGVNGINNSSKRKALPPESPERRTKFKGLTMV